jgi:poly(3-hydroxybutyrate) depolymerase
MVSLRYIAVALGLLSASEAQRSPGWGKQSSLNNGVQTINGRQYTIRLPQNYDPNQAYNLVFAFHWRGGNMNDVVGGTGIEPWYGLVTRSQNTAIFIAPNGENAGWANSGGRDATVVDGIIQQVENALCVDQSRRFSTGFSFGGGMSYALACSRASQFRAVSVLAGGVISGCSGGNDEIAYLGIHGINDGVLGINGGIDMAKRFARNNGCQDANIGRPNSGSRGSVRTNFTGCRKPVSFIAYDGGHDGAPLGVGNALAPDATWQFFMAAAGGGGTSPNPPTNPNPPSGGAALWGQCGGNGWNGPTTCESGRCVRTNEWYSQCIP